MKYDETEITSIGILILKLTEQEAKRFNIPMTKYESHWKEATYYIDPAKTKITDYFPILEFAYKKLTGL